MTTVEDLVVGGQIAAVAEIASAHGWAFERAEPARFRVSLSAGNGDTYQLEVDCAGFPVKPAAFHLAERGHWRARRPSGLSSALLSCAELLLPYRRNMRALEPARVRTRRTPHEVGSVQLAGAGGDREHRHVACDGAAHPSRTPERPLFGTPAMLRKLWSALVRVRRLASGAAPKVDGRCDQRVPWAGDCGPPRELRPGNMRALSTSSG